MRNDWKRQGDECRKCMDVLEEAAAKHADAGGVERLMEKVTSEVRKHVEACEVCREGAEELLVTKELFRGVPRAREEERPFFAARVMAAIDARERELATSLAPWMEVPRFAARLAWITALLLLAGTTWFYGRGITAASHSPSKMAGPESIFEPTAPASQDDVLISMAERKP